MYVVVLSGDGCQCDSAYCSPTAGLVRWPVVDGCKIVLLRTRATSTCFLAKCSCVFCDKRRENVIPHFWQKKKAKYVLISKQRALPRLKSHVSSLSPNRACTEFAEGEAPPPPWGGSSQSCLPRRSGCPHRAIWAFPWPEAFGCGVRRCGWTLSSPSSGSTHTSTHC